MPVNRNTDPYGGRFSRDASGSSVEAGYRQAVARRDTAMIRRNLKPYERYGLEQRISVIRGESDQERYTDAAQAVVARFRADRKAGSGNSGGGTPPAGGRAPRKPAPPRRPAPRPKPKPKPKPKLTPAALRRAVTRARRPPVVMPKPRRTAAITKAVAGAGPPAVVMPGRPIRTH